jgi:phage gpG-like protein
VPLQEKSLRIAFLEGVWKAVLFDRQEPFPKSLLAEFVSTEVIDSLPASTTLANVSAECHAREVFEESYIKSFLGLKKCWSSLMPESRQMILERLEGRQLQANGNLRRQLQPHADDRAALTIRWDTADRLYAGIHELAFKACQNAGLELLQPRGVPKQTGEFKAVLQRGETILGALLRERINIDKTAVLMAVGHATPVAKTKMMNNLARAYADCLDAFRGGLLHWALHNLQASSAVELFKGVRHAALLTPPIPESVMRECIEELLGPFMQEFERMSVHMEDLPPDTATYDKAQRFFTTSRSGTGQVPAQA